MEHKLELINGSFSPAEALEIIDQMVKKKIEFHELRNFSEQVRFGRENAQSLAALKRLVVISEQVRELFKETEEDAEIELKSEIIIHVKQPVQ